MLAAMRKRTEREDEGFTLIELMVVVLIIAILLAIAIPTFLGARDRANERAAQSSLRNALTAAKTIYTDSQVYTDATTTALFGVEPSLTYVGSSASSDDFKKVSVDSSQPSQWTGAVLSKNSVCFFIRDASGSGGGTTYGKNTGATTSTCTAATSTTFTSKW
jgi:type IV pilus assembly protein PilA